MIAAAGAGDHFFGSSQFLISQYRSSKGQDSRNITLSSNIWIPTRCHKIQWFLSIYFLLSSLLFLNSLDIFFTLKSSVSHRKPKWLRMDKQRIYMIDWGFFLPFWILNWYHFKIFLGFELILSSLNASNFVVCSWRYRHASMQAKNRSPATHILSWFELNLGPHSSIVIIIYGSWLEAMVSIALHLK